MCSLSGTRLETATKRGEVPTLPMVNGAVNGAPGLAVGNVAVRAAGFVPRLVMKPPPLLSMAALPITNVNDAPGLAFGGVAVSSAALANDVGVVSEATTIAGSMAALPITLAVSVAVLTTG